MPTTVSRAEEGRVVERGRAGVLPAALEGLTVELAAVGAASRRHRCADGPEGDRPRGRPLFRLARGGEYHRLLPLQTPLPFERPPLFEHVTAYGRPRRLLRLRPQGGERSARHVLLEECRRPGQ